MYAAVEKEKFADKLLKLMIQYEKVSYYRANELKPLYKKMWSILNIKQKITLYDNFKTRYKRYISWNHAQKIPDLYSTSYYIHHITLWQLSELNVHDKINALDILISMHKQWLTVSGRQPFLKKYNEIAEEVPATWEDICNTLREKLAGNIE